MQTSATVITAGASEVVLHKVTDPAYAGMLRQKIKELACDDSPHSRYPGPNPVSIDSSHFDRLRSQPYYVCEKTDGVRFAMVCCTLPAPLSPGRAPARPFINVCALVDRSLTAYLLPLEHVPRAMFQGSLIDGELAWNKALGRWEYLAFDAVCVSGVPVLNGTLLERLRALHKAAGVYKPSPGDPAVLTVKSFHSCTNLAEFEVSLRSLHDQYDIDGLILTPAVPAVHYGRHTGLFKLKFGDRHTVDFVVGPDGRHLSVFENGAHVSVGLLSSSQTSQVAGSVVECAMASDGVTWEVVMVRTDKSTANDMYTYKKTLLNMREGLTLQHIKLAFSAGCNP